MGIPMFKADASLDKRPGWYRGTRRPIGTRAVMPAVAPRGKTRQVECDLSCYLRCRFDAGENAETCTRICCYIVWRFGGGLGYI
jgi:hypothetical protein